MNVLDVLLLLFVALATLGGLATGFVRSAANLIGLVAGFALGSALVPWLAPLLLDWAPSPAVAGLVAFTVVALAAALALDALGILGTRLVQALRLGIVNRPLGAIPAAVSAVIVAGVALALLGGFAILERERAASRLAGWFLEVSAPIVDLLPPPWNGAPERLPPRPIPAPDAPAMARSLEIRPQFS
ncbi:MAG TPA: CvpA family protein [Gemmatimonadota bacterium]